MRSRQHLTPDEDAGIARILRITVAGIGRMWVVAFATVVLIFIPVPWRGELGRVYGYYALAVMVLGLGVLFTIGLRQLRSIRRVHREVRADRGRHASP